MSRSIFGSGYGVYVHLERAPQVQSFKKEHEQSKPAQKAKLHAVWDSYVGIPCKLSALEVQSFSSRAGSGQGQGAV